MNVSLTPMTMELIIEIQLSSTNAKVIVIYLMVDNGSKKSSMNLKLVDIG